MAEQLVSIIIPCYNDGEYLLDAIQSCQQQTYSSIEIIIINDSSTDEKTISTLNNIDSPKTTIIHHKKNIGVSAARNTGICASHGTFILPLDADDLIAPTFVEKTVAFLEQNDNIGFVSTGVRHFGIEENEYIPPPYSIKKLLYHNLYVVSSLFRKKAWEQVGGFDEGMVDGYEDWDFWLSLAKVGWSGACIPEILFYYRKKPHSKLKVAKQNHYTIVSRLIDKHNDLYEQYK